ncbi:MAG: hypothetical protein GDA52_01290 [Rhodobacteraceae bacterium]|nr:hypothetical protein [Paracoccaceae bacterium]
MRTEADFEAALEEVRRELEEQRTASEGDPSRRRRKHSKGLRSDLELPYSSFPKPFGRKWNLAPPLGK